MKHLKPAAGRRWQSGFSMIELGVALAVLGLLAMGAMAYWRATAQQRLTVVETDLQQRAGQAVLGFVYTQRRLPCPAADASGVEVCDLGAAPNHVGRLPWRTLQLPDATAGQLKYGVYRAARADSWEDMDLAVAKDRLRPLMALGTIPSAAETLLGNSTLADFCLALTLASGGAANPAALRVVSAATSPAIQNSMAYVIAAPGLLDSDNDGDGFDGLNHSAANGSPVFEGADRARGDSYDDRVMAMSFGTLFGQLRCSDAVSAIDHSHFNAALSAALMRRAVSDYHGQLQVKAVLAGAGVATALAAQAEAVASLAGAVAALVNATTFTVISYGSAGGLIAAATAAVVANTAVSVVALVKVGAAIATTVVAATQVATAAGMVTSSAALSSQIDANARNADALGF